MPDTKDTEPTDADKEISPPKTDYGGVRLCDLESEIGLRRSPWASALSRCYTLPKMRRLVLRLASRFEGGTIYSYTLRKLLWEHHRVYAGADSYGPWARPGAMPAGTVIGRYVSMAQGVKIFTRNHPSDRLSMHPFFYNKHLGYVADDTIDSTSCWIGHDAWLGDSAIITPRCNRIGIGAIVGAGSVVTKDVPNFAVVAGNPAKLIRFRFDEKTQSLILASRWWEKSIEELVSHMDFMICGLKEDASAHPLLRPKDPLYERQTES